MRTIVCWVWLAVLITHPGVVAQPADSLSGLSWLAGSWRLVDGETVVEEHWLEPAGRLMLGLNRTIRAGETVAFEYLRIEARADGVFYVASPGGGPATEFRLTESADQRVVFSNPTHDFPTQIVYRREADTLHASISGDSGEPLTWSWQLVR